MAIQNNTAFLRIVEAHEKREQSCFAGTTRPYQRDGFTLPDVEGDTIENRAACLFIAKLHVFKRYVASNALEFDSMNAIAEMLLNVQDAENFVDRNRGFF